MIKYKENRFIKAINPRNGAIVYVNKIRWERRGKSKRFGAMDRLSHLERVNGSVYYKIQSGETFDYVSKVDLDKERHIKRMESVLHVRTLCRLHNHTKGGEREPKEGYHFIDYWYSDMCCPYCERLDYDEYECKFNRATGKFEFTVTLSKSEKRELAIRAAREALQKAVSEYNETIETLNLDKKETKENEAFIKQVFTKKV